MDRRSTPFHSLLKIVTMSGQCVICQVNEPGLGYNWTTFYTLAAVTTGWGPIQHIFSWTIMVADNWLNILWFFCVLTCSTTLLGGGIFQTIVYEYQPKDGDQLCGWNLKAGMARVWWQLKLCDPLYNTSITRLWFIFNARYNFFYYYYFYYKQFRCTCMIKHT